MKTRPHSNDTTIFELKLTYSLFIKDLREVVSDLRFEYGGKLLADLEINIEEALLDLLREVDDLRVVGDFMQEDGGYVSPGLHNGVYLLLHILLGLLRREVLHV